MSGLDSVRRFLVTAPDENLTSFHLSIAFVLNGIERRQQTVIYTCMREDSAFAMKAAEAADVTLQEIEIVDDVETYPVLRLGRHGLQWQRATA